ncbi:SWIM zinc finger family protein [Paenibacillus eucommiae]|uniref:SWIM-type domain-containing protein n=1 Tax=Paenibacillus eucommiae TaxID=1355755 RepID=A0ABS4J2S1_9BACL|nr:SWIM zinc finger family protein [Paenibacillus eucommiae]MBP1994130.1 hypothetical protein [Paenibacillus eucommiae]
MNLNNLRKYVDPVILDRGRDYLKGGHVLSIEEIEDLVYRAEVEGSEIYEVHIELDEEGEVTSSECDCPFDFGPVCKHQVAVLLKLRDHTAALSESETNELDTNPKKSLKQLLEVESKESLVALLLSLAADSDAVEHRIKLFTSKVGGAKELGACRRLIRSYINTYADHHGFVSWRNVDQAVLGAEMVAKKAIETAENAEWVRAVEINFCVLEEMVDFLQETDDSSGTVGSIIKESLARVEEITLEMDQISQMDREKLFQLLLHELRQSRYVGWPDWQLTMLASASHLAVTADLRKEWEQHVSRMVSEQAVGGSISGAYFADQIAAMRYGLILIHEDEVRASDFLNSHLHISGFREKAISDAFHNVRFEEVIRLSEEGEAQDRAKGLAGLVKQWKKHRYEAYCRSGQLALQRKLGVELVLDGEYSYYNLLKDTYPNSEWRPVYLDMLQKLEKDIWPRSIHTRILVEEQEYSRLLAYVKKQPSRIEEFYSYLNRDFPMDVKELFNIHIETEADRSTSRKHYENVCRIILLLQQAGGKEEAFLITQQLLAKYPRRPAFRDELMKLKH